MIFAFTALAIGLGAASPWIFGAAIVADVAILAGAGMSVYSGYQAQSAANESAAQQLSASQAAADAQRMAAAAQAQQASDQAELARLQANIEDKKAGVAQEQGEIEAEKRSRLLAYDIGNIYSQWAGNGLLVDGGDDTLGALLTSNTREAAQDIGVIKANTENSVWEHEMNKTAALMTAESYSRAASNALLAGEANAQATLASGWAQAYATKQSGLTALYQGWGGGISAIGSMGSSIAMAGIKRGI